MPYFSIIIPLYNKESFLEATLKSVFNQTFKNFEVIIVNDGSTDNSLKVLDSFSDNRLCIINQENQGVSIARNIGIETAKSNYICFLDADDFWMPNHLESFANLIERFPDAKMYCSRYITQISKNKFTSNILKDISNDFEGYVINFFKSSTINRVALTSAVCINKEVFYKIGGFNKSISSGQDLDYWIRIALNYKIAISNKTTLIYNYINANKSLSKTSIKNKKLPNLELYKNYEKDNESLKHFLDIYRIEYALHHYTLGLKIEAKKYLSNVNKKNIRFKTKILFYIPPFILRLLLKSKHKLKSYGIDFSVYH